MRMSMLAALLALVSCGKSEEGPKPGEGTDLADHAARKWIETVMQERSKGSMTLVSMRRVSDGPREGGGSGRTYELEVEFGRDGWWDPTEKDERVFLFPTDGGRDHIQVRKGERRMLEFRYTVR